MLMRFISSIARIAFYGSKIIMKSLKKSLAEEIELSNEKAMARNKEKSLERKNKENMSLDEAMRILNLNRLDPEEIEKNYKLLFDANMSGSFYLLSKIFRARERIIAEMVNVENAGSKLKENVFKCNNVKNKKCEI